MKSSKAQIPVSKSQSSVAGKGKAVGPIRTPFTDRVVGGKK